MIRLIFYLTTLFILVSCANQMSPPGGDIDRVPPEVIETYPNDGTIFF